MNAHALQTPNPYALHWLLGAMVLVILPNLGRIPLWLAAFCVAVIGWRLLREHYRWPLPGRFTKNGLTLIAIILIGVKYHSLFGREAGLALLTTMLCLKLLELKDLRDAMVMVFIAFFLEVASFLYSQSIAVGAYLFLVVLVLTTVLITLNHPRASLKDTRRYVRTAGQLVLLALPLMVVLFILFPRITSPLWGLPADAFSGKTGLSDHMTMGNISKLTNSNEVAFRVDFEGEAPPADKLYWRGPVLWHTDGRSWTRAEDYFQLLLSRQGVQYQAAGGPVNYALTLEPHNKKWIFALDLPANPPPDTSIQGDFQMLANKKLAHRTRYTLQAYPTYRATQLDDRQWLEALQLPDTGNRQTRALIQAWLDQGLSDRQLVEQALAHFREGEYYYTRQPPLLGDEVVDEFLFETRQGFCEHYAASFTFMMRLAGIPARVVTGYQGGETNPVGNYLIVRQSDAHAWSEVYLEEFGWTRVDPTAVIPPGRVMAEADLGRFRSTADTLSAEQLQTLTRLFRSLRRNWDALSHQWNLWVIGYNTQRQQQFLRSLGLGHLSWRGLGGVLAATLGIGLMIAFLALFWPKKDKIDPVLREYQRFCRKLLKLGLERQAGEGPMDFARRVSEQRPELAESVQAITRAYTELRYRESGSEHSLEQLRRWVRAFKPQTSY